MMLDDDDDDDDFYCTFSHVTLSSMHRIYQTYQKKSRDIFTAVNTMQIKRIALAPTTSAVCDDASWPALACLLMVEFIAMTKCPRVMSVS